MIELRDVGMTYNGNFEALKPTSIHFKAGEFSVLLGTSGAGKSTMLRMINMLNVPSRGEVIIEGFGKLGNSHSSLRKVRREVAMVFQQHQLIPRNTALQNVLTGMLGRYGSLRTFFPFSKDDKRFALECLERVDLLHKANERVDKLSGGQQQRVGIARSLAQRPGIILADEPVASLDPVTSEKVLSILHRICKEESLTAIVSLHQVELAQKFADRIIGLSDGEVVFDGNIEALNQQSLASIYNQSVTRAVSDEHAGAELSLELASDPV